jgi:hypothetical protein
MTRNEAIFETRRKKQVGEFTRAVVKITRVDFYMDRIELKYGHAAMSLWNQRASCRSRRASREAR